jgi:predicted ATPase
VHGRIAQVLTVHFPETVETQPEWLAHHCTEAGLTEAAVGYWHQAGLRAHQQSAYAEAFAHVTRGLEVVETLPEGPLRSRHELALLVMLRQPLAVTKGYGAPVLEQVNVRVRALCQHVDEPGLVRQALAGLWTFYSVRDMAVAYELAEQVYTLASRLQTPGYLLWGHVMVAEILVFRGEFCRVLEHVEACGRLYDPQQHRPQVTRSQQDPRVTNLRDAALALWHLGYPDQALQHANDAVALAQDLDHPYTLTWALHGASRMHRLRRAFQQAFEWSERSLALATEGGFALFAIQGELMRAWMLIERGQVDQGMAQMHQALSVLRDTGSRSNLSFWLSLLAEVYGRIGQANDGLHLIAEALEVVERSGIRMSEAELHRSKGALLLQQPVPDAEQAEACFQHALDIARQQQAKSWELRAAISLSRLWKAEGKIQQAHDLLAPVYAWFTEGFDTADVQEAKRLLEELAEGGMSPGRTCPPGA